MATYPSDEIKKIIDFLWDSDYRFKAGGREKTFMEYGINVKCLVEQLL